jgi:hypothetical protein
MGFRRSLGSVLDASAAGGGDVELAGDGCGDEGGAAFGEEDELA